MVLQEEAARQKQAAQQRAAQQALARLVLRGSLPTSPALQCIICLDAIHLVLRPDERTCSA